MFDDVRSLELSLAIASGAVLRWLRGGWRPTFFGWVVAISAVVVTSAVFGQPDGLVSQAAATVLLYATGVSVIAGVRTRGRIEIQEFTDYTGEGVGRGLDTVLAANVSSLRRLYQQVDERLPPRSATPEPEVMARSGPVDATIRTEGLAAAIGTAVSGDSSIRVGPIQVPARPLIGLLTGLFRGPRLATSVGRIDGRLVLVARLTGGGTGRSWRIDEAEGVRGPRPLEGMLDELATRVFTDLALGGSVRWTATERFCDGLRAYAECLRTRRDLQLNLRLAEHCLVETLALDEQFDLVHYNLGVVYRAMGQLDAASAAFDAAVEHDNRDWRAYYGLAVNAYERERLEDAYEHCRQAMRIQPKLAEAHELAARSAFARGLATDALGLWERAVHLAWSDLLRSVRRGAPPGPALTRRFSLAHEASANLGTAYVLTAVGAARWVRWVRLTKAITMLRLALRLVPRNATTYSHLGLAYTVLGWHRSAAAAYTNALLIDPSTLDWAQLAKAHAVLGRQAQTMAAALTLLQQADEGPDEDRIAALKIASTACARVDATDAAARLRNAAELLAELSAARSLAEPGRKKLRKRAAAETRAGRHWEAAHIELVLARSEPNPEQCASLYRSAIAAYNRAAPAAVRRSGLRAEYARTLRLQNKFVEAVRQAERAMQLDPVGAFERIELGRNYFELQDYKRAAAVWEEALLWEPGNADLYADIGECHAQTAALESDREHRREHLVQACEYRSKALELHPSATREETHVRYKLARLLQVQGHHDAAIAHFRALLRTDFVWPLANLYLAVALRRAGFFDDSAVMLSLLIDEIGRRAAAGRSVTDQVGVGDYDARQLGSVLAFAQCALAYNYAERGVRLDEALRLVKAARKSLPSGEEPWIRQQCFSFFTEAEGLVRFREGKWAASIARFAASVALSPDPEVYVRMGTALCEKAQAHPRQRNLALIQATLCCDLARRTDLDASFDAEVAQLSARISAMASNRTPAGSVRRSA